MADPMTWGSFVNNMLLVAAAIICSLPILPPVKKFVLNSRSNMVYMVGRYAAMAACIALLIISSILLVNATNNPFLYFRF